MESFTAAVVVASMVFSLLVAIDDWINPPTTALSKFRMAANFTWIAVAAGWLTYHFTGTNP